MLGERPLYRFRFRTGLRGRECTRILWGDLDLADSTLTLRPGVTKNRKPDLVPLTSDLRNALTNLKPSALRNSTADLSEDDQAAVFALVDESVSRRLGAWRLSYPSFDL